MPIYFGSNFAREPFQFDSVGNDWEQESVTRPEGYPLYHYLQTKEGVGEVTVYSRNQAVSDNILSNSHTIELQKGQGILIAPNVPHSYHNKNISSGNSLPWKTEFATFTGTMAAAFREMFDEKEYRLIDENKGMEVSEAINRAVEDFKEHSSDTQMLSLDCYSIMLLLSDQSNHTHDNDDQSYVRFIKPVIDAIEESYMDDISAKELADGVFVSQQYLSRVFTEFMNCSVYEYLTNYRINKAKELLLINSRRKVQDIASDVGYSDASHFYRHVQETYRDDTGAVSEAAYITSSTIRIPYLSRSTLPSMTSMPSALRRLACSSAPPKANAPDSSPFAFTTL